MKRVTAGLMVLLALGGCTTHAKKATARPSKSAASTGAGCSEASAKAGRQVLITNSRFDPSCIKVKKGVQFFFVNSDVKKVHSVTTLVGSPAQFDAELPKKTSTFAYTFKKTGTYQIKDKHGTEKLTVIVM